METEIIRSPVDLQPKLFRDKADKLAYANAHILGYVLSEWFNMPQEETERFFPRHPNSMIEVKENNESNIT